MYKFSTVKKVGNKLSGEVSRLFTEHNVLTEVDKFQGPLVMPAVFNIVNKIVLKRDENGLVSPTSTLRGLKEQIDLGGFSFADGSPIDFDIMKNIFNYLKYSPRGGIYTPKQTQNPRYGGNVPLFMSVFKELRGVKYMEWDLSDISGLSVFTDEDNLDIIKCAGSDIEWTPDELAELSILIRTNKGGRNPGSVNAITTYSNKKTGNHDFDELPKYVRMMLTQVWLFNPQFDHSLAFRNLQDLDARAVPIPNATPKVLMKSLNADLGNDGNDYWDNM